MHGALRCFPRAKANIALATRYAVGSALRSIHPFESR